MRRTFQGPLKLDFKATGKVSDKELLELLNETLQKFIPEQRGMFAGNSFCAYDLKITPARVKKCHEVRRVAAD